MAPSSRPAGGANGSLRSPRLAGRAGCIGGGGAGREQLQQQPLQLVRFGHAARSAFAAAEPALARLGDADAVLAER